MAVYHQAKEELEKKEKEQELADARAAVEAAAAAAANKVNEFAHNFLFNKKIVQKSFIYDAGSSSGPASIRCQILITYISVIYGSANNS